MNDPSISVNYLISIEHFDTNFYRKFKNPSNFNFLAEKILYHLQFRSLTSCIDWFFGKTDIFALLSRGDHTEVIDIEFDPSVITYSQLLRLFWKNHEYGLTGPIKRQVNIKRKFKNFLPEFRDIILKIISSDLEICIFRTFDFFMQIFFHF